MTKRGMSIALLTAALLALTGASAAQAAGLSVETATKLANELGRKQVHTQDVVAYHLGKAKRLGANSISFRYDARTHDHLFCVSVLTVKEHKHGKVLRITARLSHQNCIRIPDDALAFEKATRTAQRAVRDRQSSTLRSITREAASERRCRKQRVPRSRRSAVKAILDTAETDALVQPNVTPLDDLVSALSLVGTDNATLDAAASGWADWVDATESLPQIDDPCATIRHWAKHHWAADQSPIDMTAYHAEVKRTRSDVKAIVKGAKYLASVGVFPETVAAFVPEGLLLP